MRIAVAEDFKKISKTVILPTPRRFTDGVLLFKKTAAELAQGKKIKAVCGGVPGALNKSKTMILNAPNLSGWNRKPLAKELKKIFQAPVFLENDAALAGLGEAVYGAGKGKRIAAYLTVSTGVGGGRIVEGRIDQSAFGFEPGHQIIFVSNKNAVLDLGDLISGRAIEKKYGKKPYEIFDAKIWDNIARDLAYGLNNVAVFWSPDVIILGGSMMKKIGIPTERIRFHLSKILKIFPKVPPIKKAKLGDLAGLCGALACLKQRAWPRTFSSDDFIHRVR